ncbi:hypothetical protein BGZ75_007020 [Mortierella antarctica]|nr:hypothetical protein BGZ75_007020 [Mortierella antarctica]
MFARKGSRIFLSQSSSQSLALNTKGSGVWFKQQANTTRSFRSSAKAASQTPEPTRVPRPIPLDIGNSPSAAFFQSSGGAGAGAQAQSTLAATASSKYQRSAGGSVFGRFGGPIIKVIMYSTAATLAMHLLYHQLALEEYKISSSKKVADLETEIAGLKAQRTSQSVQHPLGGRGEFV